MFFKLQKLFPIISKYYPSGTSLSTLLHFQQMYTSGQYKQLDFGEEQNMKRYKRESPPDYDISKISAPVSLHYGEGDFLVTEKVGILKK